MHAKALVNVKDNLGELVHFISPQAQTQAATRGNKLRSPLRHLAYPIHVSLNGKDG